MATTIRRPFAMAKTILKRSLKAQTVYRSFQTQVPLPIITKSSTPLQVFASARQHVFFQSSSRRAYHAPANPAKSTTPAERFADRVVLVTGGTSGLGADTCELFVKEGAKVFVTDLRERDILQRLGPENAHFHKCDISSVSDCETAVKACIEHFGRLDVLFHNGARLADLATVVDHDIGTFDSVIKTNLCGLFYLARAAVPQMQKQGKGTIVATASTAGLFGDYGLAAYAAAKAGTVNLIRTMALDHAREGIRVNCVCPGYMVTPMTDGFRAKPHVHEALLESIPMNRGADPKEIARVVLFLASDDASFITGQALVIDGGWTASSGCPNFPKLLGLVAEKATS